MNPHINQMMKNLSYTVFANLFSMIISILLLLIVPKMIDVEQYGLWQLSVFYCSYVGFFHFGWIDGIYLRYGGKSYAELDKKMFNAQFWALVITELIVACIILFFTMCFVDINVEKAIPLSMALSCVIQLPGTFLRFVLQATNRLNEYAKNVIIERGIYGIFILIPLFLGSKSFVPLVMANIVALLVSTTNVAVYCKDIVFIQNFKKTPGLISEITENIICGGSLLIANISAMLVTGSIRVAIEKVWDIQTFSQLSLTLNICNFIMIFINALSLVVFPLLKRIQMDQWKEIFVSMRELLTLTILILLISFFPAKTLLLYWLPHYKQSLFFLGIVFPMCLYEGKVALLCNTYLKALRKERTLLTINLQTFGMAVVAVGITAYMLKMLYLSVFCIVICLAYKCICSEIFVMKTIGCKKDLLFVCEVVMVTAFVISTSLISNVVLGFMFYLVSILIYILLRRRQLYSSVRYFIAALKHSN